MHDPAKEMEDVHKCMAVIQAAEVRYVASSINLIYIPESLPDGMLQGDCGKFARRTGF
jgi:hypothetical protein